MFKRYLILAIVLMTVACTIIIESEDITMEENPEKEVELNTGDDLAAGLTAVRVFQSHATGGLVYCRTGSLPASSHEDLGTAEVADAEAVDCP
jgi:Na+-transporting NADH:ubiquinone oxidoreductase subunit NqrF